MNSKKLYSIFYYISLLLSIFVCFIPKILLPNDQFYINLSELSHIIIFVNAILVVIFTVLLIKRNLEKVNILFPIIYILFSIIVLIICVLFNNRLIIPYVHYSYYIQFILVNYTLLNSYSILSFKKNKNNL
jgi:hypothetical protein